MRKALTFGVALAAAAAFLGSCGTESGPSKPTTRPSAMLATPSPTGAPTEAIAPQEEPLSNDQASESEEEPLPGATPDQGEWPRGCIVPPGDVLAHGGTVNEALADGVGVDWWQECKRREATKLFSDAKSKGTLDDVCSNKQVWWPIVKPREAVTEKLWTEQDFMDVANEFC